MITNTIYWRPPENRKPTEQELKQCWPFLSQMIKIIKPKIIILCGATAIENILGVKTKMIEIVGKFQNANIVFNDNTTAEIVVFPVYHPSFLLRQPSMKKKFWEHLLILQEKIKCI